MTTKLIGIYKGGSGSGNYGHEGRPGLVGGSASDYCVGNSQEEEQSYIGQYWPNLNTEMQTWSANDENDEMFTLQAAAMHVFDSPFKDYHEGKYKRLMEPNRNSRPEYNPTIEQYEDTVKRQYEYTQSLLKKDYPSGKVTLYRVFHNVYDNNALPMDSDTELTSRAPLSSWSLSQEGGDVAIEYWGRNMGYRAVKAEISIKDIFAYGKSSWGLRRHPAEQEFIVISRNTPVKAKVIDYKADDTVYPSIIINKGGSGSGNYGHEGRPGKVGGSADKHTYIKFNAPGMGPYGNDTLYRQDVKAIMPTRRQILYGLNRTKLTLSQEQFDEFQAWYNSSKADFKKHPTGVMPTTKSYTVNGNKVYVVKGNEELPDDLIDDIKTSTNGNRVIYNATTHNWHIASRDVFEMDHADFLLEALEGYEPVQTEEIQVRGIFAYESNELFMYDMKDEAEYVINEPDPLKVRRLQARMSRNIDDLYRHVFKVNGKEPQIAVMDFADFAGKEHNGTVGVPADNIVEYLLTSHIVNKGGEGSGNYGHEGRPGLVGGSATTELIIPTNSANYNIVDNTSDPGDYWIIDDKVLDVGEYGHVDSGKEIIRANAAMFVGKPVNREQEIYDAIFAEGAVRVVQGDSMVQLETANVDDRTLKKLQNLVLDRKLILPKNVNSTMPSIIWSTGYKATGFIAATNDEFINATRVIVKGADIELKQLLTGTVVNKGGEGSGNYGHKGRPGKIGGSSPNGLTVHASFKDLVARNYGNIVGFFITPYDELVKVKEHEYGSHEDIARIMAKSKKYGSMIKIAEGSRGDIYEKAAIASGFIRSEYASSEKALYIESNTFNTDVLHRLQSIILGNGDKIERIIIEGFYKGNQTPDNYVPHSEISYDDFVKADRAFIHPSGMLRLKQLTGKLKNAH